MRETSTSSEITNCCNMREQSLPSYSFISPFQSYDFLSGSWHLLINFMMYKLHKCRERFNALTFQRYRSCTLVLLKICFHEVNGFYSVCSWRDPINNMRAKCSCNVVPSHDAQFGITGLANITSQEIYFSLNNIPF